MRGCIDICIARLTEYTLCLGNAYGTGIGVGLGEGLYRHMYSAPH